jgi:hypothetical protein
VTDYPATNPCWYFRITGNKPVTDDWMANQLYPADCFANAEVMIVWGRGTPIEFPVSIYAPTWLDAVNEACRRITTLPGIHPAAIGFSDTDMTLDCAARYLAPAIHPRNVHGLSDILRPGRTARIGPRAYYTWADITAALTGLGHAIPDPVPALTAAAAILARHQPKDPHQ